MIKKLLLLLALLALWVALLWLVIGIDISKHGNLSLAAIHLLPPLTLWAGWLGWRAWRVRKQEAAPADEAEAKRIALEQQRAAGREKFDKDLAERRARVDIRWLQVRDLSKQENAESLAIATDDLQVALLDEEMAEIVDETAAAWPSMQLTELFAALQTRCPAALTFPVYVLGPSDRALADLVETVRTARETAAAQMDVAWPQEIAWGAVLSLPQSIASSQALIDLCVTQPEMPGALVLTFESPLSRAPLGEEEANPEIKQHERWLGKPGQALVGLLLTAPTLPQVLAQLDERAPKGADDVMTPYWERAQLSPGMMSVLAPLPTAWRKTLADMPMIAQLRRPAWVDLEEKKHRTQNLSLLLEQAGVNAALIEPKFDAAADGEAEPPLTQKLGDSAWVVHNAGNLEVYGNRLASVSTAMSGAGIALTLMHESTNVVERAGDCGCATPYLMLALAAAKTAELKKPSLVTHFQAKRVAMSFVVPPRV